MPGELHRHLVQATTSAQARREPCLPSGHLNCALDTEEGAGAGAGVELLGLGDQAEMQHTLGPGRGGENIFTGAHVTVLLKLNLYHVMTLMVVAQVSKIKIKTIFIITFVL